MKVLYFVTTIDRNAGGIATYLQLLSQHLKNKIEIAVVTGTSENPVNFEGVPVYYLDFSFISWWSLNIRFADILKKYKPDIVHINGIWEPQTWCFQSEAQQQGIKVVLSPHGMLEPYILNRHRLKKKIALALYQDKAIKSANYLHVTAQAELENIQDLRYFQPTGVIPNGIDLSKILSKTVWNNGFKNILFLSRIHPKKGIELLIDAVGKLNHYEFIITIAGIGDEKYIESLKKRAVEKKVSHLFRFVGGIFGLKKWKLFQQSDLFVLPTYSENFGIVVAEALATGIPVITTTGTPWQELETHRCGWWIELNVPNLVKALNEAMELNANELQEMGLRGRQLIIDKYQIQAVAKNMFEFYQQICRDVACRV